MKRKRIGMIISMLVMASVISIPGALTNESEQVVIVTNSQNGGWYKTYGGDGLDCFKGLDVTPDGGFIVAGETEVDGSKEAWLVKIDGNGAVLWDLIYGTPDGRDALWPVLTLSKGGYLAGGWYYNKTQGTNDALLIKTDENGAIMWAKTYGGDGDDQFYALVEAPDGYLAVGMSSSYSEGTYDGFVMKIAFDGTMLWVKALAKEGYSSEVDSITAANEGDGYIISGGHYSAEEACQGRLLKIDMNGNILWDKSYGEASFYDWWCSVANTNDNNYIIAGGTRGGPFGKGIIGPDIWLIKVDNTGNIIWDRSFGFPVFKDYSVCAQPTSDGGYILTGHVLGIGSFGDAAYATISKICLIKTDSTGNVEWEQHLPDLGHGRTVRELTDGYIICGFEGPGHGTGSEYGILIRTDKNGNIG